MKTSTEIASIAKITGEERAVELVAKSGFDAWDFSLFEMGRYDWQARDYIRTGHPLQSSGYAEFARRLKRIGLDNGITCNQSHAPFPSYCPAIRDMLRRAIECTAIAGGEICVIHPCNSESAEYNAEMYLELLPFAKEHGVKIATENMWNWDDERDEAAPAACSHHDDFLKHIKAVNDPYFVACLDIGHAEMRGLGTSARESILTLGEHLDALHIHDNDRHRDSHALPFTMDIDFREVVGALKRIGYQGYFTLEADRHLAGYTADSVAIGVKEMADATRRLADMFDNLHT
ncbi:MAG: sugar phosphate isomerase/epimerase [Clostridia bacterium]|nr:sugar phosphate isomerase/epimerase [Clostridia bacterium]